MWTIIVREPQGSEIARAELKEGVLVLGRGKDCGLMLPSSAVSRKHARLEQRGERLFLFDEGSANGCIVDGRRVVAPVEVTPRSAIQITPFRIVVEGDAGHEDQKTVMLKNPPTPAMAEPSLSDLRPMMSAPSIPAQPAATAPDSGYAVRFPEPAAAPKPASSPPPKSQAEADEAAAELERHIQGIRTYREQTSSNTNTQKIRLDQGWTQLVGAMQNVQKRLAGNARVQGFNFSRDGKEIAVKIQDAREKRGYRYFVLARQHPEGKFPGLEVIWVCETGREDMNFRDAKDAQTEIFQRIAATLA